MTKLTVEERFWAKVRFLGAAPGECWEWDGARSSTGYGNFKAAGRWVGAHRFAYELTIGPIPDQLNLDHLCRNRACVNPAHLEPVTNAENLRRGGAAITHCPQDHPFDEANTYWFRGRARQCRSCDRERKRAKRAA